MPVQTGVFQPRIVLPVDRLFPREVEHKGDDKNPGKDMEPVQAGHNVVKPEKEDLSLVSSEQYRGIRVDAQADLGPTRNT